MVELDIEWRIDSVNRRRLQNRIAQRKFRQSRKISKTTHDNNDQPPSNRGSYSTTEKDSIAAQDFQNSTPFEISPPNHFVGVMTSTERSDSSMTGSPSVKSNNSVLGMDNIGFIDSQISSNNSSLSKPQTMNFSSKFDQILDFVSLNASNTPATSSVGLEYLNFCGTLTGTLLTIH